MASPISDSIYHLAKNVCSEFVRKPRSLRDVDRWKAVEYFVSCRIKRPAEGRSLSPLYVAKSCINSVPFVKKSVHAEKLLRGFVKDMPHLYGDAAMLVTAFEPMDHWTHIVLSAL
jgi:hypothetical protein